MWEVFLGIRMELPTITEMRNDYSVIVKNLENLIETLASKNHLSQKEYESLFGRTINGFPKLETKMAYFASSDKFQSKISKSYLKANKELGKILKKLYYTSHIEAEHLELNNFFPWEHIYKTTKMRIDILNHLKVVLRDLKKLQKEI